MITGYKDPDFLILSKLDDRSLFNLCLVSKEKNTAICNNEGFWKNRFINKFGNSLHPMLNETWKKLYANIVFINEKSKNNPNKALELAARQGRKDLSDYYISQGAKYLNLGLRGAAFSGNEDLVRYFMKKSDNLHRALYGAAEGGHLNIINILNENRLPSLYTTSELEGKGGNLELIKMFFRGDDLSGAIIAASAGGHLDLLKILISKNNKFSKGLTNLDLTWGAAEAIKEGHKNVLDFYIEKGFKDWDIGLSAAAEGEQTDLINFFLTKGATDMYGGLNGAAKSGNLDLVKFFINKGANDPIKWGLSVFLALEEGHVDILDFFLKNGYHAFTPAVLRYQSNIPAMKKYLQSLMK